MAISKARRARRDAVHAAQEQVNRANPDIKVKNVPDKGRALIWEPSDGRSVEPGTKCLYNTIPKILISALSRYYLASIETEKRHLERS